MTGSNRHLEAALPQLLRNNRTDSAVGVFYGDGGFLGSVAATPQAHAAVFDIAHGVVYAPGTAGLMSFAPPVWRATGTMSSASISIPTKWRW